MKKRIFGLLLLIVAIMFFGCGEKPDPDDPVIIDKLGVITLNFVSDSVVERTVEYSNNFEAYTPAKEGFDFVCWTIDGEDIDWNSFEKSLSIFNQKSLATEITLVAKWTRHVFHISYEVNGGVELEPSGVEYKKSIETLPTPVKENYTFLGWYTDEEFTTPYDLTTSVESDFTLYAKWIDSFFTIKFDTDGGTEVEDVVVGYNTKLTAFPEVEKTGYVFKGWYSDSEFKNEYKLDTVVDKEYTIYAKWEIIKLTVKFLQSTFEDVVVDYGSGISNLPQPTKDEHTFRGWFKDQALENEYVANAPITENLTLYPKFSKNSYIVKFVTNGGSTIKDTEIICNTKLGNIISTRLGYRFTGWFKDSGLTTPFGFEDIVTSDMTLYAGWEALTYTVVLNYVAPTKEDELQGIITLDVNNTDTDKVVSYGEKLTIKVPTVVGFKFDGWYTYYDSSNGEYRGEWNLSEDTVTKNMTLYAKWSIQTYTITLNYMDGKQPPTIRTITVNAGERAQRPSEPTLNGFKFVGWYDGASYTTSNKWDWETPVTSDIILYAGWQEKIG